MTNVDKRTKKLKKRRMETLKEAGIDSKTARRRKGNAVKTEEEKQQPSLVRVTAGIDLPFFILVMLLLLFGLVMVFSSSHVSAFFRHNDSYYFIKRQAMWALIGVVGMIVVSRIDYKIYAKHGIPWMAMTVSIILLVAVLFYGTEANGAKRWLFGFQPSEIAKTSVIVFFSYYVVVFAKKMKTLVTGMLIPCAILGIIAFLMLKEPHMSGTILIVIVSFIILLIGGVSLKWLISAGILGVSGLAYIMTFTSYMAERIAMWRDPWQDARDKGFQAIQSLYAIGSGGLLGVGLGNSRQKYLYMPEPQNDFIFSITCEELGFIGALFIILLFVLLIWRGFVISFKSKDRFGTMLVVGIVSRVAVQTILNIAVVTNFIPVTGISLPFFSYGGTALVILLLEMGIVLNVARHSYVPKS